MRAAGCMILGLLGVLGCGSESMEPNGATGTAGMAVGAAGQSSAGTQAEAGKSGGGASGTGAAGNTSSAAGRSGSGGAAGTGSAVAGSGGKPAAGSGGAGAGGMTAAGSGGSGSGGSAGAAGSGPVATDKFSFFVTSLGGMTMLAKNDQGFGGDLRFGESTGLAGADKICTQLAEKSMPGAGGKGWRAFLSTAKGGMNDGPIHARDRIGQGPWYDRNARLVAMNLTQLIMQRPGGADAMIINDLPNENGIPNHKDTMPGADDNHDTVTGSNAMGMYDGTPTCNDWTSTGTTGGAAGSGGRSGGGGGGSKGPRIGHSWPAGSGMHWIAAHQAPGCSPSVALVQMGGGSGTGIGNGGGYGGIYCFALKP